MSADHAVFPIVECHYGYRPSFDMGGNPTRCDQAPEDGATRLQKCSGCLGDGRRVLLDQGVPVVDVLDEANQDIDGEVISLWGEMA